MSIPIAVNPPLELDQSWQVVFELRKWCVDVAVRSGESGPELIEASQAVYDWVTQKHAPEVYTK